MFSFEVQQGLILGDSEDCGNRDSILSIHEISHALGFRAEGIIRKNLEARLTQAGLGEFPREAEGNWSSLQGHRH